MTVVPAGAQTGLLKRCWWCGSDALYVHYHDTEWGVPVTDDRRLFEKLALEGFQAGLSWITILRKRERFRETFEGFDPRRVAEFDARRVARLLRDPGIVRHRGKIEAVIANARAYSELVVREGSLSRFAWSFAEMRSSSPTQPSDIPTQTVASQAFSRQLKRRGWRFVGPTTAYAFFQAMGIVNDHVSSCFRRAPIAKLRSATLVAVRG